MTSNVISLTEHLYDLTLYSAINIPSFQDSLQHALDLHVLYSGSFQSISLKFSYYILIHLLTYNLHAYLVDGINVIPDNTILDLDIMTDFDLNYTSHISSIVSKSSSESAIIFRSLFSHKITLPRQATLHLFVPYENTPQKF